MFLNYLSLVNKNRIGIRFNKNLKTLCTIVSSNHGMLNYHLNRIYIHISFCACLEQRKMLGKLIRYGVELSLEDIESLSPFSKSYIIPFNQRLTKPFALVCYTTEDRPGSIEEAQTVMKALKSLGLNVFGNSWGNIRELERSLEDKLDEIKHECNFLLLSIMAHGFRGHVLGEDGSRGKLNTLIDMVNQKLSKSIPVVCTR